MCEYATNYPIYNWDKNKGYGTRNILALKRYGLSPLHRKSFLKNIIKQ